MEIHDALFDHEPSNVFVEGSGKVWGPFHTILIIMLQMPCFAREPCVSERAKCGVGADPAARRSYDKVTTEDYGSYCKATSVRSQHTLHSHRSSVVIATTTKARIIITMKGTTAAPDKKQIRSALTKAGLIRIDTDVLSKCA
jgi:hypothetical protein